MSQSVPQARGLKRLGYLLLAWASLGMAVLGAILPGLPCTEFVLLSAWAASRSSPRLSRWLEQHRLFGPLLRDWRDGGYISRRSKLTASLAMLVCLGMLLWHQPPLWVVLCAVGGMSCGAAYIWSRPERSHPR